MRINVAPPTNWKDLQNQVARILSECGLTAEVERTVQTARGRVNVDVHAVDEAQVPTMIYLCECKYWSSAVSKDVVHAFRTVFADFGASGGFLIFTAGFQSGAYEAAGFSNVRLMNWDEFEACWIERWTEKYLRPKLFDAHERLSDYTEPLIGTHVARRADALPPVRRQRFIDLRNDPSKVLPSAIALHLGAPWHRMFGDATLDLPLAACTPQWSMEFAPRDLIATQSLREFGDILCRWIAEVTAEFDDVFNGEAL